jgi:hypothetical protein
MDRCFLCLQQYELTFLIQNISGWKVEPGGMPKMLPTPGPTAPADRDTGFTKENSIARASDGLRAIKRSESDNDRELVGAHPLSS